MALRLSRLPLLFIAVFIVLSAAVQHSVVDAAGGTTLSPPLRDLTLGPGLIEANTDIALTNNTSQQVRASLRLVDLKALGEFGGTSLDKAGLPDSYGLANWMELPGGNTVIIPGGKTVNVAVKILNKPDLSPGGHYGAVIVTTDSDDSVKSNVNISQQLVSLVFVKKLGGEKYGLELKGMSADKGGNIPDVVKLNFIDTGNVHIIPRGYVEISDPKGKLVARGIINPDSSLILPGQTRQFVTLMKPVESSNIPGQYKITAYYRYDGNDEFTTQNLYFTRSGVPIHLKIIGIVIGVAIFTSAGILFWLRSDRFKSGKK